MYYFTVTFTYVIVLIKIYVVPYISIIKDIYQLTH